MTSDRTQGMTQSSDRGGLGWILERGSLPREWLSTGWAPQGSGHSTEPARVQAVSGQCTQMHGLIFGLSSVEPLDSMILTGLFQLQIFYDFMSFILVHLWYNFL